MTKKQLLLADDDVEDGRSLDVATNNRISSEISINHKYATKFEERKRKEEIRALEQKYSNQLRQGILAKKNRTIERELLTEPLLGKNANVTAAELEHFSDCDSDSTDVVEDDIGELMTPETDIQLLTTLSKLRNKEPSIYNENIEFFDEKSMKNVRDTWQENNQRRQSHNVKPLSLKEYHSKLLLDGFGQGEEGDDLQNNIGENEEVLHSRSYVEDQAFLKAETKAAFFGPNGTESDDEENNEGLLMVKKSDSNNNENIPSYRDMLLTSSGVSEPSLHKEDPDQVFLMDYILNQKWIRAPKNNPANKDNLKSNKDQSTTVGNEHQRNISNNDDSADGLSEAEAFEATMNLRYEENRSAPKSNVNVNTITLETSSEEEEESVGQKIVSCPGDSTLANNLVGYARSLPGLVRRPGNPHSDARQRQRMAKRERRMALKMQQLEDLKRLKNLKKLDRIQKLTKISQIAGISTIEQNIADLLGNDTFGNFPGSKSGQLEKEIDEEEGSDWDADAYDKKMAAVFNDTYYNADEENPEDLFHDIDNSLFLDADEDSVDDTHGSKDFKNARAEISDSKSNNTRSYNDTEVDLPEKEYKLSSSKSRFRYAPVLASSFGLSTEDIISAPEKLLNAHISIKKFAPYKSHEEQIADSHQYSKKKRLRSFRHELEKVIPKISTMQNDDPIVDKKEKRKHYKEAIRLQNETLLSTPIDEHPQQSAQTIDGTNMQEEESLPLSTIATKATKKRKRSHKKSKANPSSVLS